MKLNFLTSLFVLPLILSAADFSLVKNGKAQAVIVVDKKAPPMVQYAAKEFRDFIKKASGAELKIQNQLPGKGQKAVLIGESAATRKLGIDPKKLSADGFIVKADKNHLILCGRDYAGKPIAGISHPFRLKQSYNAKYKINRFGETGTLYAVYSFLEKFCGMRWFMPGPLGEVVPKTKDISVADQTFYTKAPDYKYRFLWNCDFPRSEEGTLWYRRAGFGAEYPVNIQHSFYSRFKKYRTTNPEYFALLPDGKRDFDISCQGHGNLCLSNPEVLKTFIKEAREFLDADPAQRMFPVMPNDSFSQICACAPCQKQIDHSSNRGRFSNYVWNFVNKVAAEIKKSHPDKIISCCAYGYYYVPPTNIEKFHDNVAVMICRKSMFYGTKALKAEDDKLINAWLAKIAPERLYFWEYQNLGEQMPFYRNVPVPVPRLLASEFKRLKGISGGVFIESPNMTKEKKYHLPGLYHLNWYVSARMMWDAGTDIEALMDDYYVKFYGPAAPEMKKFWERCERIWMTDTPDRHNDLYRKLYNLSNVQEITGYLAAARKKTAKNSLYRKRVELLQKEISPLLGRVKNNLVTSKPQGQCFPAGKSPVLDGVISPDECWTKLPVHKFVSPAGEMISDGTDARFAYDDKYLYCFFKFAASQADRFGFKALTKENDSPRKPYIWDDDSVELFLNFSPGNREQVYQIVVNAGGAVFDQHVYKTGTAWNSNAKFAIKKEQFAWNIEMAIPLSRFNLDGKKLADKTITANFVRNHVDGTVMRRSCWSPTLTGHNNNPDAFAPFTFKTGSSFEALPADVLKACAAFDRAKAGDDNLYAEAGKLFAACVKKHAADKKLQYKVLYLQALCAYLAGDIQNASALCKKLIAQWGTPALKQLAKVPEQAGKFKVPAKSAELAAMLKGFARIHIDAAKQAKKLQGKYVLKVPAFSAAQPWDFAAVTLAVLSETGAFNVRQVFDKAAQAQCAANLKHIGVLMFIYAQANNGHFPKAYIRKPVKATWYVQIYKTAGLRYKTMSFCPLVQKGIGCGMNNIFMGDTKIPRRNNIILAADSVHYAPGNYPHKPNLAGASYKIAQEMEHSGTGTVDRSRHFGGANALFCDGSVKWMKAEEFTGNIWRR